MFRIGRIVLVLLAVASVVAVPPAAADNSDQVDSRQAVLETIAETEPANAHPDTVRDIAGWLEANGEAELSQAEYLRVRGWLQEAVDAQSLGVDVPDRPTGDSDSSTTSSDLSKAEVMRTVKNTQPAEASPAEIQEIGHWVSSEGPDQLTVNEYRAARTWVRQGIGATNAELNTTMPSVDEFRDAVTQDAPEKDATNLTYQQLNPRGSPPSANAPQGVRAADAYSEYGLQTLPTELWALPFEGDQSPLWSFMSSDATVKRNKIKFATNRPRTTEDVSIEDKNYTLKIAYWQPESRVVEEGNQTREVTYATNSSTVTRTYRMSDGRDEQIVPLRPHYDENYETTICVQEADDEESCLADADANRWRFTHASNNAYEVLPATSQGRRTVYAFGLVGITVLVTLVTLFGVRKLIEKALASPNISLLVWVILGLAGLIGLVLMWESLVEMFVLRPFLIAVPVGIFLGIVVAEWFGDSTYLAAAIRFSLDEVQDPGKQVDNDEVGSGDLAADGGDELEDTDAVPGGDDDDSAQGVLKMDIVPMRMVRHEQGRATVSEGARAFLARARGARSDVDYDGNPLTRVEVDGGPYEEAYLLDPESDQPIEHQPEGHSINIPAPISRETVEKENGETVTRWETNIKPYVIGIGALATGWVGGALLFTNGLLGLAASGFLVFALGIAKPDKGYMQLDLAPLHYHTAVGTMLQHAAKLGDAKSWQTMYEEIKAEKGRNRAEEKSLEDRGARSQATAVTEEYVGPEPEYQPDNHAENGRQEVPADDD